MDRRNALLLLGFGGLAAAAVPVSKSLAETSQPGVELFCGDFETGDSSQYAATEVSGGTVKPRIVSDPTRSSRSRFACAYTLTGPQYRCESVPGYRDTPFVAAEGSDLYYGWSVYFQDDFPRARWQVCAQWHQTYLGGSGKFDDVPPPMAFYVGSTVKGDDRWYLSNNGMNPWEKGWSIDLGPVPRGRWTDIVVHAVFSTDPSQCLVEIWMNGSPAGSLVPPVPTLYPTEDAANRASYFKVGYYRDPKSTVTGTVLFDEVRIGRDYESVAPKSS